MGSRFRDWKGTPGASRRWHSQWRSHIILKCLWHRREERREPYIIEGKDKSSEKVFVYNVAMPPVSLAVPPQRKTKKEKENCNMGKAKNLYNANASQTFSIDINRGTFIS